MKNRDFSKYDTMSTAQLEQYLRQDFQLGQEETDTELLLYIMEVLASRQATNPQWEQLETHYLPCDATGPLYQLEEPTRKRRRIFPSLLVAIVVLVALFAGVAQADSDRQENNVAAWDNEEFVFQAQHMPMELAEDGKTDVPVVEKKLTPEELFLVEIEPYLPTWMPEGYILTNHNTDHTTYCHIYLDEYRCGDSNIMVCISQMASGNANSTFEKDGTPVVPYWHNGLQFYQMSNGQRKVLVWRSNNTECMIQGLVTPETLVQIMESIPGPPWLRNNLEQLNIVEPVTPQWLPEGYTLVSSESLNTMEGRRLDTIYQCGIEKITMTLTSPGDAPPSGETYQAGGIDHTLVQGELFTHIYWQISGWQCHIQGPVSMEEAKSIVDSLYQ